MLQTTLKMKFKKELRLTDWTKKTLTDLTGGINSEIDKAKQNLLGDSANSITGFATNFTSEITNASNAVEGKPSVTAVSTEDINEIEGPIKRQM